MKKNFKKSKFVILPALATLVLTGVASVTGTVAWFTASKNVTVSGMSFTAQSESNLLIAGDTLKNDTKVQDSLFASTLNQSVTGSLKPASTVDARNFFATEKAKADGSSEDNKYTDVSANTDTNYFKDYVFQLKAINVTETAQNIYVDNLDIKYGTGYATGDLADAVKAFRAAFFVESASTSGTFKLGTTTDTGENKISVKSIYTPAGAANQTSGQAVSSTTATGSVTYVDAKQNLTTAATGTSYFKLICRVWLEGEDKKCTDDLFKSATQSWNVSLGLRLGSDDEMNGTTNPAITNIKVSA